ncbi:MAG: 30S ribosomal protein S5 [Planctomycetes bacterium]|nr:30S ribosomal protein S5 [Planctomycetota bacterium]
MTEENKSPAEEPAESADAGSAEAAPAPEKEAPAAEAPAEIPAEAPAEAPTEAPAEAPAKSEDAPAEAAPPRENTGRPGGGRGGPGGGRGGRGGGRRGRDDGGDSRYEERVVKINRCSKVIKGGRRFSFSALVVLGDREGSVGIGFGKANEVPPSVEKAMKIARNDFTKVSIHGNTIPHKIVGSYRSSRVVMLPATEGTGIIAGAPVRAVVECAGVKDLLTKVHGSTNPLNVVKATMNGLKQLRTREEVSMLRGVEIPE